MKPLRSIWGVLTPRQRSAALVLLGMMLLSMLLEMLSVGMVLPALTFLSSSFLKQSPGPMTAWLEWLGNPTQKQLIMVGLGLLLVVYAVKSTFLVYTHYRQSNFIAALQSSLTQRMFSIYLSQPWTFHLSRNSAELNRNINEIQSFCVTCTQALNSMADGFVILGIVGLLVIMEPVGALVVGSLLAFAAWLFDRLTGAWSRELGKARLHHARMAMQLMLQGLGAAKDVKIHGCEKEFVRQHASHSEGLSRTAAHHTFFAQMPRLWYELLAVGALCAFTTVLILQNRPLRSLIPTLGIFAAAAFRLLPSVNRLSHSLQNLRFSTATIDVIERELSLDQPPPREAVSQPMPFRRVLAVKHVSYSYPNAVSPALHDVSIQIEHGKSVGIIGASGAGKSTLVDVILGLLSPTSGRIEVDGIDIQGDLRAWMQGLGYVPQSIYLCDDTIRRNVAFGLPDEEIDDAAVGRAIRAAQLDVFVAELPQGLDTTVGERGVRLSGGQRQRIGIARALYRDPSMLVLDEATSALDDATEREVMRAVNALHGVKTLLIVAHRLSTVERCDIVYRLDRGRITDAGSLARVAGGW